MSTHITEEIPRLLTGEANRDAVLAAAEHLRSCPDCQQELVSAVVAHASLTSAHRFAPEVVAPPSADTHDHLDSSDGVSSLPAVTSLPPMTSMFEKIRQEAELEATRKQAAPRRRRLVAVAAAAVILAGGGAAIAEVATSSSSSATHQAVSLSPFDQGSQRAQATIVDDRVVRIDATHLRRLDSDHVYELWLTDGARQKMWPVGSFNNQKADLPIEAKVLSKYSNFEVSIQRTSQTQYSGVSVLRGQYKS